MKHVKSAFYEKQIKIAFHMFYISVFIRGVCDILKFGNAAVIKGAFGAR